MNYQRIILVGKVTRDAERRTSQSGEVTYTALGFGVSDGKDKTTIFSVLVFGKCGETVAQYITKDRQVLIDGRVIIQGLLDGSEAARFDLADLSTPLGVI